MGRIFKSRLPPSSMILISHRGNTNGKFESYENEPNYIDKAIKEGYDVEIDVWYIDGLIYLGHDKPQYGIDFRWIQDRFNRLWVHCKNVEAVVYFKECGYIINYFWHQEDTLTLTSQNYIWAHPGKQPIKNSIAVMPEINNDTITHCIGICSDYIKNY
jgi:hypothetical protein